MLANLESDVQIVKTKRAIEMERAIKILLILFGKLK